MASFTKPPAKKGVMLEGRTRLPQRVQDIIVELGNSVQSIQQAPGISDALTTSIRNFATVDGIAQNSSTNLEKILKQLERMEFQTEGIEKGGLDKVNEVLDKVDSLEQSAYCTLSSKSARENVGNVQKNSSKPTASSPIQSKR